MYLYSLSLSIVRHTATYPLYQRYLHLIQSIFLLRVFLVHIQQTFSLFLLFLLFFCVCRLYYMEGIYCSRIEISTEQQFCMKTIDKYHQPIFFASTILSLSQSVSDFTSEFIQNFTSELIFTRKKKCTF